MANKIEWEEKFSVDIPELDECQKALFEKFNALIDLKAENADAKAVINMISEINDFSKMYFSKEEKMLRTKKYPDLETHAKAHRQFIKNAISMRREIAEDINNLTMEALVQQRDWLVDHIQTSDCLYVPFLRIHQYIDGTQKKN
ncbi:MAG: hemerythrin family protein [Desulfobacter sp.]|nr:hemerythrin family protein [Desulfobacter sp.]WDP86165.1 MAG: hemerythrin family protein [Desulfobacter sp.]